MKLLIPIPVVFFTITWVLSGVLADESAKGSPEQLAFFEARIRPLLLAKCVDCHGADAQEGGLRLDSRAGWQAGGASGPAVIPEHPESSLLIQAVRWREKDLKMPPEEQLSVDEIALLEKWIQNGAVDPRKVESATTQASAHEDWEAEFRKRLDWWSLQPIAAVELPPASDELWAQPVDRFVHSRRQAAGLPAAPMASAEVLLRRLSIVLTGLPPTPAQHVAFLSAWNRDAETAYVALVDQLLQSPHFGERMARHWMDVVRYTDTYGYEWDNPAKGSHEYRDYLIRAFNNDVGFDTLLREQIAGDLLSEPRINSDEGINESVIGPMFYHMGEHRHGSSLAFNGIHQEMVNNKIDAFSKAFLATTVACARCHNHKLEAVSQRDYYALGAIFMTPRWTSRPADAPDRNIQAITALKQLRTEIRRELSQRWSDRMLSPDEWKGVVTSPDAAPPKLEDIAYPLTKLSKEDAAAGLAEWQTLAAEWNAARNARVTANAAFTPLADISKSELPDGWVTDGAGLTHGWVADGTPLIALEGDAVVARLLPAGWHTHALSSRLPGALRTPPQHVVVGKFVSVQVAGGEYSGILTMHENSFQNEPLTFLNHVKPKWQTFADTALKNGVTRVTIDFATSSLNPNFPPRTGLAPGLPNDDLGYDKRSWLSITGIVSHDAGGTPQDTLDAFETLYTGSAPVSAADVDVRLTAWLTGAVQRWCRKDCRPGDRDIVDWLLTQKLLPNAAAADSSLQELLTKYREIEAAIEFPRTVNSMDEREVAVTGLHLNVRGNVDALGERVTPDFLQMFAGQHGVADSNGSGRLELADFLLQPDHPLTSRVYVNRVWQWVFGQGLVTTPDDFGRLGDKPSHPKLLDWLARDFQTHGWSTRQLVRKLVLTQTFRQSGAVTQKAQQLDPDNRLWHHYPTQRMQAEVIRDSLLAVSGRLDRQLYGRPVNPPRSSEDDKKRLFSGPLDGDGRRSLYLTASIMAPSRFLTAFDLPDLKLPTGRRNVTNVPPQSLLLMNDKFVTGLAEHWASWLVNENHSTPDERVEAMLVRAFGRLSTPTERQLWVNAVMDFASGPDVLADHEAWRQLAHAMFNAKEFIYFR
ncbi:MAG: PSD1 and planctomycete cytochrome C domain-containing protein [Planctomycetaceae bacterium]